VAVVREGAVGDHPTDPLEQLVITDLGRLASVVTESTSTPPVNGTCISAFTCVGGIERLLVSVIFIQTSFLERKLPDHGFGFPYGCVSRGTLR